MNYIFKGRLWGYICSECFEPLSAVKIRLYRSRKDQNITSLAVAQPKDTFAILTEAQVKEKSSSLIAETTSDSNGNFEFNLGEKQKYNGEAFEIDIYCESVPHGKPLPKKPAVQFSITTIQPVWKGTENDLVAAWEYGLNRRFWCMIRALFGAWTICGKVVVCDTSIPVLGVRVRAFDTDWTQDDPLGDAITNVDGKFRIDYVASDFQKTPHSPFINVELIGGPDVYFRVETPDGTPLLIEPSSKGRTPGRENIGNCFCVELCLKDAPTNTIPTIPLFTNVGEYHVDPVYGDFTSAGLTSSGNFAFTGDIPLIGILPDGQNPQSVEYRFQYGEYDSTGTVLGAVSPIETGMIKPTIIGKLEYWAWRAVPGVWELKSADYWVNKPGASVSIPQDGAPALVVSLNKDVKPGGWIEVPRENSLLPGGAGRFIPNGNLIDLMTTKFTDENFDLTVPAPGMKAGDNVPAGKKSRAYTFKLFFEARVVGTLPLLPGSNTLDKIIFSNTLYRYNRHPNWAASTPNVRSVVSLDILELTGPSAGAGCGKLTNHVHALFTVYHPFLGSARVYFEGNSPLPSELPLTIVGGESASGSGGHDFDISALAPCAYVLWLEATVNLTSGYGRISNATIWDHIAFCKG